MKEKEEENVLREIAQESMNDKEKKVSLWWRVVLLMVTVIMIFFLVSYIFTTYPLESILLGSFDSTRFRENSLQLENFTVYFENNTTQSIGSLYLQEQEVEFSLCLQGYKEDENYYITSSYQPKMYQQTFSQVRFEACSQDTLIIFHTHPYKHCVASKTDLDTLRKTQEQNPETLMLIMCEKEKASMYK